MTSYPSMQYTIPACQSLVYGGQVNWPKTSPKYNISISFVLFAFSWTRMDIKNEMMEVDNIYLEDVEVIPRTINTPPAHLLPLPSVEHVIEVTADVILDKSEFEETIIPMNTKVSNDISIDTEPATTIPVEPIMVSPNTDIDKIFIIVAQMPRFPGCEDL